MKPQQYGDRELIYKILGIDETEYKLKSIPKNILSSINSIHIASKDIEVITEDLQDDPNSTELLHNLNSYVRKEKRRLLYLWEITDNLSKANLNKDRVLLSQIMPRLTRIRERV